MSLGCDVLLPANASTEALLSKFLDPDEKVRAAVCKVYGQLDYETALHHVSESQLRALAERAVDKKVNHIFWKTFSCTLIVSIAIRSSRSVDKFRQTL